MELANVLCRYAEMSDTVAFDARIPIAEDNALFHLRKSAIQGFWPQFRRRGYNPLGHHLSQSRCGRAAFPGEIVSDDLLAHVAPLGWEHITFNGDYVWPTEPLQNDFWPLQDPRSAFLDAA
jgi:hypothetical protein